MGAVPCAVTKRVIFSFILLVIPSWGGALPLYREGLPSPDPTPQLAKLNN